MKETRLSIKCTYEEKARYKETARNLGYPTLTDYVLATLDNHVVFIENISGYQSIYAEVNKIGTNINQIAKHVNTYKNANADDLKAVQKELKKIQIQLETLRGYRHFEKVEIRHGSY